MSLNEAIRRALVHDPTIDKIHADVTQAQGFRTEVRSEYFPKLGVESQVGPAMRDRDFTGGQTFIHRRAGVTATQYVWDSGFTWYRLQDANTRIKAREELDRAQRETTAIGTVEAYLDVIRARKQIVYARESVAAHENVLDLSNKRAEAAGNQADVELATARLNLARKLVIEREVALKQAEAAFVRFVGVKPGDLSSPHPPRIGSLAEIDPRENFHYIATVRQHDAALLQKKALERQYGPRFHIESNSGIGTDVLGERGRDNDASVLFVGSWDIFDGGRRRGLIEQAIGDIQRELANIEETLVLLSQDISARWADYRTIQERIDRLHDYAAALAQTLDLYRQQFDLGSRPLLSLLDIQNELISSRISTADAERDQAFLAYRLLFFGGRLLKSTVGTGYLVPAGTKDAKDVSRPRIVARSGSSSKKLPAATEDIALVVHPLEPIAAPAPEAPAPKAPTPAFRTASSSGLVVRQ